MSKFVINGGNKLFGEVTVQSAKNSLLPLISACILIDGKVTFLNCNKLNDVCVMLDIIKALGGSYSWNGSSLTVDCSSLTSYELPKELTSKIRASIFCLGPLLGRFHKALFFKSGGCDIGERPIDLHINGLTKLGAEFSLGDVIYSRVDEVIGSEITLPFKSVGATENIMMLASVCKGKTVIKNCAKEPEISNLAELLRRAGGEIYGAGTDVIEVYGVPKLKSNDIVFTPVPDRIETGTYLLSTLSTGGEVTIKNCIFSHNVALIKKIYNNACKISINNDKIYIKSMGVGNSLGFVKTAPYPGYPTDLQTPLVAYASTLNGMTIVHEGVFSSRFNQIAELKKMGADLTVVKNRVVIEGVRTLYGATVTALDLRGGAGMVIAGLKAHGQTVINNAEIIDRGYYDLEGKLRSLGADVTRIHDEI
ncbi:MAG: UDP-N-acetylglucosamine 1-carboxyvinyltransferase [Clostridia bacterium]|nr:UDP-N-acetylglucosamine 1-carboxyvinyltransferase [Clostridia bacterium]